MFHTLEEPFGFDLPAIDIMRGRDYGLPTYNRFREACGLCKLQTFEDFANEMRNPGVGRFYFLSNIRSKNFALLILELMNFEDKLIITFRNGQGSNPPVSFPRRFVFLIRINS